MLNKKRSFLGLNIISLFFIVGLLILPIHVQAYNNLIINLEAPKENEILNGNELNVKGSIDSKEKVKSIEVYLNNEKIGQAEAEVAISKDSIYITKFQYKKGIDNIKSGEHLLKIIAMDENEQKEEKSLKIYVENQQKKTVENNKLQSEENNNTYKETKASSVPLTGKATIQTYDIMLGNQYITNGKLSTGKEYTIKGYASSPNGVLYEFWVKEVSTGVWTKIRDYKEDRYANWTPNKNGQYVIAVNVKDKYSNANMDGRVEKTFTVETQSGKATIQTYDIMLENQYITSGKLSTGKEYTIKGYASSPNGVLYEFWVKEASTGVWIKIRDYKEDRYANWTPSKNGQYVIAVNVKDKYSNANIDGRIEKTFTVETQSGKATIQTYDIMLENQYITNGKLSTGKEYTIKGYASSPNGVLYEFWVKEASTGVWTKIRDYKEDRYANWTPSKSGQYVIAVNVKDKYSNANMDGRIEKTFTVEIQSGKATIQTYDIMLGNQYITGGKLSSGKTYTIKGYASSPNGVLYEFWVKEVSTGVWTKIRDYKEDRYANWTPNKSGQFVIAVNVKDKYSSASVDGKVEKSFNVDCEQGKATIQTYDIMLGDKYITSYQLEIGKTYTIKGYANSTNKVLYEFWVKDLNTGSLIKIRDFNEDRYANWTPTKLGRYAIIVKVKDIFSSNVSDSQVEKTFAVISNAGSKTVVVDAGHGGYDSGAVGPTGIKEKDVTLKVALKLGKILENNGVKVIYTRTSDNVSWPSNESQDLAARVAIANSNKTDLYVSIHTNSFNGSANGTETYYYDGSAKGKETAEKVQKELVNSIGLYDRGVKTAGYYVLKNTISPSILVELGFIDNRNEEILLNSDWFQQKCAEAIAKGILGTSFM
ncbi:N-acetylmuramoyl-L-alanine amidase [Clostridium sporogenes]|uniref:N-acetylmuramoyl-L-alanine amidase n=1 Tax=Clostridium sporogenes TaxID=1509 RepID=A0AAE4FM21_CLOSG|nr:N-acetylmuramoyl-L-alanine amidase [Clostridium sporogenes]MDS1003616.1 N-acetylmuramoyl-L-alanine amidase [Clostridium sporogenes]